MPPSSFAEQSYGPNPQALLNYLLITEPLKSLYSTKSKRSAFISSIFKRAESGLTRDGLLAGRAALGEKLAEAVGAVGLVVPGGEPLPGQGLLTVGAGEALPVPGVVAVGHAALRDDLAALDAFGRELVLIAFGAVNIVLFGNE